MGIVAMRSQPPTPEPPEPPELTRPQASMRIICAWCGAVLLPGPARGKVVISHGICVTCREQLDPE